MNTTVHSTHSADATVTYFVLISMSHVHVQKLGPPYSQGIRSQLMAGNAQVDPTRPHALVDSDASRETKTVKNFQLRAQLEGIAGRVED